MLLQDLRCAWASEHTPWAVAGGRTLCAPTSGAPGRRALRPLVGTAQEIIRRHIKIICQGNQALKIRTAPPTLIILIGTYLNPQIFRYLPLGGTFSLPFQGHALCKFYQLTTSLLTCTICAVIICTDSASSDVTSFFEGVNDLTDLLEALFRYVEETQLKAYLNADPQYRPAVLQSEQWEDSLSDRLDDFFQDFGCCGRII